MILNEFNTNKSKPRVDWQKLVCELQKTIKEMEERANQQQESIRKLEESVKTQEEVIKRLKAELKKQKNLKDRPQIRASRINSIQIGTEVEGQVKRAGSAKVSKKTTFEVDEERIIEPPEIPEGAKFKGYRDYDVQELIIKRHNIRFRLKEYIQEDGGLIVGELPEEYRQGHYGPKLVGHILYQHYQCRVTQPILREQLEEWKIDISSGQLHNILVERQEEFHQEQEEVLEVGLKESAYIHTDDTGARHQGKNGYCTVIGNDLFTYFRSSERKSRENFLEMLQGGKTIYVLNEYAKQYLQSQPLAAKYREQIKYSDTVIAADKTKWEAYLLSHEIISVKTKQMISEAALLGGAMSLGINPDLRILSDGAGQFNILRHALCWVHAERSLRKLVGATLWEQENIDEMQDLLWQYYRSLKAYQQTPTDMGKAHLLLAFAQIFDRSYLKQGLPKQDLVNHEALNNVLRWFRTHKAELLEVLELPSLPLHNNSAETDIREYVIRRKISGGTRSDAGRRARDTFIGLKKTCRKLGISFWQYLIARLCRDQKIPPLSDVMRSKIATALQVSLAT